jgi:transposase
MDVLYERCCGLDVHKKTVVACVLTPGRPGQPQQAVRTFGTMTADLLALADWLEAAGVTHVAMESTGVYWQPIWNLLEDRFTLLLANPQHVKQVPGRKTDVRDSEWLAQLLRHGLVQASFVPPRPQRELRELTRYRTALVRERSTAVNRLQKTLEGANLKLGSVASNVVGLSGRQMLAALVAGTTEPTALAALAQGKLRAKRAQLEQALTGSFGAHHRFLVAQHLVHLDSLDEQIAAVSAEIAERLRPFEDALDRLDGVPGIGRSTAEVLLAELGTEMARFPTAGHAASWAGLCPGQHESAGKRRSGKTRQANPWLRTALVEAAQGAARTQGSYFAAQYRRIAHRRGRKRALVAVAHSLLVRVYSLLRRGTTYAELGDTYFDARDHDRLRRYHVQKLEQLGFTVALTPQDPAA